MTVLTILANPEIQPLDQASLDSMALKLCAQGITIESSDWLKDDVACDLYVKGYEPDALHEAIRPIIGDQPFDAIAQAQDTRAKTLLISDMDSTMIEQECIDELADFVGKKTEVATITERAMNGELDFETALKERVALLAGLSEDTLKQCYNERITLMPGAQKILAAHKETGGRAVLVSGGFTFFTSHVRDVLGFDADYSNILEIKDGLLTGKVIEPIQDKEAKVKQLNRAVDELQITPDKVLAIGDGANDIPMLKAAGLGIAYHAKPHVRKHIGAQLNHCDLSALIYVLALENDPLI